MYMDKKSFSERDICTNFITPAIEKASWNKLTQLLEEVCFTDGKIYVRGELTSHGKLRTISCTGIEQKKVQIFTNRQTTNKPTHKMEHLIFYNTYANANINKRATFIHCLNIVLIEILS